MPETLTRPLFCRACNEVGHRCRGSLFPRVHRTLYWRRRGRLCRRYHGGNGRVRRNAEVESERLTFPHPATGRLYWYRACFYCQRLTERPSLMPREVPDAE
jgi:hypothetical protein